MRIAFYAPMKPPDSPVPSGDRTMARLLLAALSRAGHEVELAARLVSRDPAGNPERQARLAALGVALARRYLARATRPDLWFTYHLYYKAPDWIGPSVARALAIPYVVAEASLAPKRAGGSWDLSYRAVLDALELARLVIPLNPANAACLPHPEKLRPLPPFIDAAPGEAARRHRETTRKRLATSLGLDPAAAWIAVCAMMRPGDKLASYRELAAALSRLRTDAWALLLLGDGPAEAEVRALFAPFGEHCRFLGRLEGQEVALTLAACDLYAWPSVGEAYGMSLLEAQAAGLPVVAGVHGGVASVVAEGQSGLLVPPGDVAGFAAALSRLLADQDLRRRLAEGALRAVAKHHDLPTAARQLDAIVREAAA